jgi:hypothetical protein
MVDEPNHLVVMANRVRGRTKADGKICLPPKIDGPYGLILFDEKIWAVNPRNINDFNGMATGLEFVCQPFNYISQTALDEWYVGGTQRNFHDGFHRCVRLRAP